jgi:alpha-beta hydrolase superfamily lysophospholipase
VENVVTPKDSVPPSNSDASSGAEMAVDPETAGPREVTPTPPRDVELRAADGSSVYGRYYGIESEPPAAIILLFHQAGSNAAEYDSIAPRLQALGYAALAIDQRSGGRRFGRDNATVKQRGESTGFSAAYPDLEAALAWARERGHPRVLAWGSSYTAALVFRLGAEHGEELSALLAFSPGEYFGAKGKVAGWARRSTMPVLARGGT